MPGPAKLNSIHPTAYAAAKEAEPLVSQGLFLCIVKKNFNLLKSEKYCEFNVFTRGTQNSYSAVLVS